VDSVGMTDAIDLTTEERTTLNELLRRFLPGVDVWAYGSRVKWTARPNSDLDLVAFATPAQRPQVAELKDALAESNLPFPVDLHVWNDVPERFREIIRKEYVVVQEDKQPDGRTGVSGSGADLIQTAEIGDVPDHWTVAPLGTFVSRVTYGFTNPMPTTKDGPFMVTAKDIHGGRIDYGTARHTSWDAYGDEVTDKSRPRIGDVLLTKDGSIGRVAICDRPDVCINQSVALIQPNERIHSRFLKFLLETAHYQNRMEGDSDGTTIKHIYITRVDKMQLAVPPLDEQRAIAHILGTLDDKIELNRRMNETLEAMARALFKSWFVDFDPVRAKAEGRDTGLPKHIADLFPDSFEDSELGEIPKGWAVTSVGEVAHVIDCLHSKKPERRELGMPLLQLGNIRENGLIDMEDTYFIDEADYRQWVSRMEASPGDCVITNVGRVGAAAQMPVAQKAALGRNITGVRCKPGFPFPTVLIECLLSEPMKNEIRLKMDTGTILDALNVRNIPSLRFVGPQTLSIWECFEEKVRPIRAQMESRLAESRTLAALRDTLLPNLISGELRVKDAERFMESAV
jgi:type I restriction enzyme, S subunit